jgi:hypothetical protein
MTVSDPAIRAEDFEQQLHNSVSRQSCVFLSVSAEDLDGCGEESQRAWSANSKLHDLLILFNKIIAVKINLTYRQTNSYT